MGWGASDGTGVVGPHPPPAPPFCKGGGEGGAGFRCAGWVGFRDSVGWRRHWCGRPPPPPAPPLQGGERAVLGFARGMGGIQGG